MRYRVRVPPKAGFVDFSVLVRDLFREVLVFLPMIWAMNAVYSDFLLGSVPI